MVATWLNTAFAGVDGGIFNFVHNLAKNCGGFFTPIMKFITMLGDGGWAFIVLGIVLLFFKKTRKAGIAVLIAIAFGYLFTNLTLKKLIARPRPYVADEQYKAFWQFVNGVKESENSFPSGHTTTAAAAMMALFLIYNKKWSWVFLLFAALMGFTRIYIVVHYFTDVVAGYISGSLAGVLAVVVKNLIYKKLDKCGDNKIISYVLNFDIIEFAKYLFSKNTKSE